MVEPLLEEQYGFQKNRSTQDLISALRQVSEKLIDKDKGAYICFVVLIKAFDRVNVQDIKKALKEKGVTLGHWKAILSLFAKSKNYVRISNHSSKEFRS